MEWYAICRLCDWRGNPKECECIEVDGCLTKIAHECPRCGSRSVGIETDASYEELLVGLYVSYAKRALIGGGKGRFVIEQLRESNPELAEAVVEKAKQELAVR